ncbi:uncharacterized protein LOC141718862 [Apium graveolens]|uniref:uncharacterized protein LOC141718862 n=1 Tax=Apium graveolens TaxID=4045 RepID=UPI003D7AD7FA
MRPQRRVGIYIGFNSPSIIRYLEPLIGDVFTARYADCHFDESVFPSLGGDNILHKLNASGLSSMNPRTKQCESEVIRIIHMQNIANKMPDAFNDSRHIIKSHIPASGRPVGAKDIVPRKRKLIGHAPEVASVPKNIPEAVLPPEEVRAPEVAISNIPKAVSPPEEVKPLKWL